MITRTSTDTGNVAELLALDHLKKIGFTLKQKNFRCKAGEIDLIMEEIVKSEYCLVFIEVRYRRQEIFGSAAATVTAAKQAKIIKAAQYYRQINKITDLIPCRFDVVSLAGSQTHPKIEWFKNAF